MNKDCFIAEDLLPLYNEGLLQDETVEWLESHLATCENCRELAEISKEPVAKEKIESTIDNEKMFTKIKLRLSIYQIIIVAISFIFAIKTSMLNNSLEFILSYTVLGVITYLFYKSFWIVGAITFLPLFIWSLVDSFINYFNGHINFNQLILGFPGAFFIGAIHLIFAFIGSLVGLLILKLKESE
ncbi:MAG TPA: zf-HC2 domain-containing protein [Bacillaceae bacterium]|nr:zf-HC2 domain-containing protein [Paenibacillus bovis]HLU23876.1 zf-HC2 domain-containing protein [Bacillaceae bacterium]